MSNKRKNTGKNAQSIRPATAHVEDAGKVRLGGISPSVGPVRSVSIAVTDNGKVRLGGIAPSV
jgi:hypothetical protein